MKIHVLSVIFVALMLSSFPFLRVFAKQADVPVFEPDIKKTNWTPVFHGVSVSENSATSPRLQKIHAIRIDLHEKGVSFFTTPRRPDQFEPDQNETVRQRTNEFLGLYDLQVAVNANFFSVPKGEVYAKPGSSDLRGLAISDGIVVSKPDSRHPFFAVKKDGTPIIAANLESDDELDELVAAVAGSAIILKGGEFLTRSDKSVHPWTAVGISKDKRYVYLLVIDGRREGYSIGATTPETAAWLRFFGASDGLNLDGGGSTTMVAQDRDGRPNIVNRPSDRQPRYNGNNLGVRAQPLAQSP